MAMTSTSATGVTGKVIAAIIIGIAGLGFLAVLTYGGLIKKDAKTNKTLIDTYKESAKPRLPDLAFIKYAITNAFGQGSMKEEDDDNEEDEPQGSEPTKKEQQS